MEEHSRKGKIRVNAASLVDLKAALFRKQQEVKSAGTSKSGAKKVSEKTASIWRKPPKKAVTTDKDKASRSTVPDLSYEEELDLAKSRAALEAKAALYDKLSTGCDLLSSDDDDDDNQLKIMVDFQRKIYEQVSQKRKQLLAADAPNVVKETESNEPAGDQEEWVDYTDSLGRFRRCLKKDLPKMLQMDREIDSQRSSRSGSSSPELLSADILREREIQKWEEEAYKKPSLSNYIEDSDSYSKEEVPVHYQTVKQKEIRNVGVGYYSFDVDEEKREEQIKMLNKLREETKDQRTKRERVKEKRKALLEEKLSRIKQAKMKQKGGANTSTEGKKEALLSSEIAEFDFFDKESSKDSSKGVVSEPSLDKLIEEQVSEARKQTEAESRKKHKRPWDKGKILDPIRKQKIKLEDERLLEFAPPNSYDKKLLCSTKSTFNSTLPQPPLLPPPPPPPPFSTEQDSLVHQPMCEPRSSTLPSQIYNQYPTYSYWPPPFIPIPNQFIPSTTSSSTSQSSSTYMYAGQQ